MKTVRRDKLRRLVEAGKVVVVESYDFDDQMGESRNGAKGAPAAIAPQDWKDRKPGICYLRPDEFESSSGRAWDNGNGVITLKVHSNSSYGFRVLPEPASVAPEPTSPPAQAPARVRVMLVRDSEDVPAYYSESVTSPVAIVAACQDLAQSDREVFRVLHLDTRGKVVSFEDVSIGTLNASLVHPREVFKSAILANASHIAIAHNHPSGDTTPSREDREVTRRLAKAGSLLGIQVIDHVIFGPGGKTTSLASTDSDLFTSRWEG